MKTIELSLAKNYVPNWTLVDAIRELIANALDTGTADISITQDDGLLISTDSGAIPVEHLLLGSGSKSEATDTIGQFNEGLKLALLILARENINHCIINSKETWTPYIAKSETFGIDCLHLDIEDYDNSQYEDQVVIEIKHLDSDILEEVRSKNLCFHDDLDLIETPHGDIIKDSNMAGQIFCGGVWVCEDTRFDYGYNFNTDVLKLDRDRKQISTFDLAWQTKDLWRYVEDDNFKDAVGAILSDSKDTQYLHHTSSSKTLANAVLDEYQESSDVDEDTVLVGDYNTYEDLKSSGVKAKYISNEALISVIKKADNYKHPQDYVVKSLSPMEILVDFQEQWCDNMDSDLEEAYQEMLDKLENLI